MLVDTGGVMTIPNRDGMDSDGIAVTTSGGPEALDRAMRDAAAAGLPALIEKQAAAAVEESSSIIFVVDGQVLKSFSFVLSRTVRLLEID